MYATQGFAAVRSGTHPDAPPTHAGSAQRSGPHAPDGSGQSGSGDGPDDASLRAMAMAIQNSRVTRDQAFGADLFMDSAWDILTTLFVHAPTDRGVSLAVLCREARQPLPRTRRWISALIGCGHVVEHRDENDTLTAVGLTPSGRQAMRDVLAQNIRAIEDLTRGSHRS
jgi:hypothetical protein